MFVAGFEDNTGCFARKAEITGSGGLPETQRMGIETRGSTSFTSHFIIVRVVDPNAMMRFGSFVFYVGLE